MSPAQIENPFSITVSDIFLYRFFIEQHYLPVFGAGLVRPWGRILSTSV